MAEHPTVGPMRIFGERVWMGWVTIGVLLYSVVPPMILGRKKLPIAGRLQDKVLHTDALMQKADRMTGLAGIVGIGGLGFGLWWADSAAALLIALDIVKHGYKALKIATAELIDGTPRALKKDKIAPDAQRLSDHLSQAFPGAKVRLRESGRYIFGELRGVRQPDSGVDLRGLWPGDPDRAWRLAMISFADRRSG